MDELVVIMSCRFFLLSVFVIRSESAEYPLAYR
ncbi:MAG: hypothetical protein RLZZ476_13 [Verrucomicrobiota bacterium]|jgi:hypothetical protein